MTSERDIVFQLAQEAVFGTPVEAFVPMLGFDMLRDNRTIIQPEGYDSIAGSAGRWVEGLKTSRFLPPERDLTFEEAPVYFSAGLGNNAPTTQNSDNRYYDGTFNAVPSPLTLAIGEYLYVGFTSRFRGVRFLMSQLNAIDTTLSAEISDGASGWISVSTIYDATDALALNGTFEFEVPGDLAVWDLDTYDTLSRYWARLTPALTLDPVIITTLDIVPLAVIRTWSLPSFVIDKIDPATYTLETGAIECSFRSDYCFVDRFVLAMGQGVDWRQMFQWWGRHFEVYSPKTTHIDHILQEQILASLTKFYVDDPANPPGTTNVPNTLQEFRLDVVTGLRPVFGADGDQAYYTHRWGTPTANLSLVLECNAWMKSEIELRDSRADPPPTRLIRIQALGCEIEPGVSKSITIDMTGTWDTISSPRPDEFSDLVMDADMFVQYFPVSDVKLDIRVVNARAAIP